MKYLVVQDWNNTHGNHAGMVHMCKLLKESYPKDYEVIIKPQPKGFPYNRNFNGQIKRIWNHFITKPYYYNYTFHKEYMKLCNPMFRSLKEEDEVFLLEYLLPEAPQLSLAKYIRKNFPGVRIYALSHLTVSYFENKMGFFHKKMIKGWSDSVDKMLTLGSSLTEFFFNNGVPKEKLNTGFHYVDSQYYCKSQTLRDHDPLRVIAMGNLQRDYSLLATVVKGTPKVHYTICHGRTPVGNLFDGCKNVLLKGFLSEDELRHQMDIADVSINIMEDTIGSNVITTSLAMGLAMVVSNVGSIHDCCSKENTLFCNNSAQSFIDAINYLNNNHEVVMKMKEVSLKDSHRLNIENVHKWFNELSK